ncbi:MAG: FtsX-like permease family protein [Verrucomicrobiales bacterium]
MTPQFPRLFWRHIGRDVLRHPALVLLNVGSIALGVGVYVAVQAANQSADRAFRAGVDLVAGRAHLEVTGYELDERVWPLIRQTSGVAAATPLLEAVLPVANVSGEFLRVLGIELFTNGDFRTFDFLPPPGEESPDFEAWLGRPGQAAVSDPLMERLGWGRGETRSVETDRGLVEITAQGVVRFEDGLSAGGDRWALMDIGWAQELLGWQGRISRVLILVEQEASVTEVAERLQEKLPPGVAVRRPEQRSEQIEKMMQGFQLNLTAMSRVSLLVGAFLIFNSLSAAVVRRRTEIGMLRAMGMSRFEVRTLFLSEALVYSVAGGLLGLSLGWVLGQSLLGMVGQTISSLYVLVSLQEAVLPVEVIFVALGYGVAAGLIGAWWPAREAALVNPIEALHPGHLSAKSGHHTAWFFAGGLLSFALAWWSGWMALRSGPPWLGFAAAFFVMMGAALVVPTFTKRLSLVIQKSLRGLSGDWLLWRMAAANVERSLHRCAVTIAALVAAVALGVGVSVMIHSFRETVGSWLNSVVAADGFVGLASTVQRDLVLPTGLADHVLAQPEVEAVETYWQGEVVLNERIFVLARVDGDDRGNIRMMPGSPANGLERFREEDQLILSEAAAARLGVGPGEVLTLPTGMGPLDYEVAGVFYDYTSDGGVVMLHAAAFDRGWGFPGAHSLAVYFEETISPEAGIVALEESVLGGFGEGRQLAVYSNAQLRSRVFEIFDQTFSVTYVLRAIAVIVAVAGIFLTLTTLVMERGRELSTYRALGMSRGQLAGMIHRESMLMGFLSGLIGAVAGLALAVVLTWVINRAYFGWSIVFSIPWSVVWWTPVWMVAASWVAAWWPAKRAAALPVAHALRFE